MNLHAESCRKQGSLLGLGQDEDQDVVPLARVYARSRAAPARARMCGVWVYFFTNTYTWISVYVEIHLCPPCAGARARDNRDHEIPKGLLVDQNARLELKSFHEWLLRDRNLAISTAAAYSSHMRSLLVDRATAAHLMQNPEDFRQTVLLRDRQLTSVGTGSRCGFRSAVRAFINFASTQKINLGRPYAAIGQPSKRVEPLPHGPLGVLVRELERRRVSFRRLVYLRWRDVSKRRRMEGEPAVLEDPETGEGYSIPIDTLKALSLWAGKGEHAQPDQPIIPVEPGSKRPMTTRALRLIARGP